MSDRLMARLVKAASEAILANRETLSELDRAIGDGDHGDNMARGLKAMAAEAETIAALPFADALRRAGRTLVMQVGGASGPLYGSALLAAGKSAKERPENLAQFVPILRAAVDAIKQRGKSDVGAKTMLDVLVPLVETLEAAPPDPITAARRAADDGLESTRAMRAKKGRAAFLGERSEGHLDPGARSSALLVHAICDVLEAQ